MCTVSMITDHFRDKWPLPQYPTIFTVQPALTNAVYTITAEQWHEYQELKRKAEEYDKRTGQPDCVKPEVAEWEARMEEFLIKRGLLAKAEPGDATA